MRKTSVTEAISACHISVSHRLLSSPYGSTCAQCVHIQFLRKPHTNRPGRFILRLSFK